MAAFAVRPIRHRRADLRRRAAGPAASDVLPERGRPPRRSSPRASRSSVPILSAAMDTVTEARSPSRWPAPAASASSTATCRSPTRPAEVDKVKRSESGMIVDPVTLGPDAPRRRRPRADGPLQHLRRPDHRRGRPPGRHPHQPRPALPRGRRPAASRRHDERAAWSPPRSGTTLDEAQDDPRSTASKSCPWSTTTARLTGLITVKDIQKKIQYPDCHQGRRGRLRVGAAIGVGPDAFERAAALIEAGVDVARRRHRPRPLRGRHRHRRARSSRQLRTSRSSPATSPPPTAPRRCSTPAPTASRSASVPAPSAPPAWSPASACRRSPPSSTAPTAAERHGVPRHRRRRHPVLGRHRQGASPPVPTPSCSAACSPASTRARAKSSSTRASASRSTAAWARWAR